MKVKVSSLANAQVMAQGFANRVVSLVCPGTELPVFKTWHLAIYMEDTQVLSDPCSPMRLDVKKVFDFCQPSDNILVHCIAGISRSTAMAISLLVRDGMSVEAAVSAIAQFSPNLYPNQLILRHADDLLGMKGALTQSVEKAVQALDRGIVIYCPECQVFYRDNGTHHCPSEQQA